MRAGLVLYVGWTVATFLLEGWPRTLLRPDAVGTRVAYAVVANILIGTLLAGLTVKWLVEQPRLARVHAGFGHRARTLVAVPAGLVLGAAVYVLQGGPAVSPVVLLNAYAQTLNVTIAEILVCWSVVGTAWYAAAGGPDHRWAAVIAGLAAASAFGVYHVGHSPPFNTLPMITRLTIVGCATSVFFVLSRDVYGTIAFHNCLALLGVVTALADAGRLDHYATLQTPLIALAAGAVAALVLTHALVVARTRSW